MHVMEYESMPLHPELFPSNVPKSSEIEAKVGRGAYAKGGGGAYAGEYGTRKCHPDFVIFLGSQSNCSVKFNELQ